MTSQPSDNFEAAVNKAINENVVLWNEFIERFTTQKINNNFEQIWLNLIKSWIK